MGLGRTLAFTGLAMGAGCDDSTTAGGRSNYDAGCYRDGSADGTCGDLGVDAANDLGVRDGFVLVDGSVPDAALNEEFLCESNSDCLPLQYCRELGEDVGSVCRDNPTGPNEAVQPDVDLCGTNQDCPEDEYCHVDGTVDGSACVANPTGPIERPDADSGVSPRLDGGVNPPRPDAAVVRPDAAVVVRPDGAVVDQDGAVVPRPDAAVIAADGATHFDAMIATDGPLSAEAGVDAASDAGDASDAASDAGDVGPDVFAGPFPPLVDAALGDAVRADAARATDAIATDGPVAVTDAARVDAVATDAIATDGPVAVTDAAKDAATDAATSDAALDAASSDAATGGVDGSGGAGGAGGNVDAAVGGSGGQGGAGGQEIPPEEPCGGPCPEGEVCDVITDVCAEPCGGPCPVEGDVCDPIENACVEPNCFVKDDCRNPEDRCLVEPENPQGGVCVSPDIAITLDVRHAANQIHSISSNGDRIHWPVEAGEGEWTGSLNAGERAAAVLIGDQLLATKATCGYLMGECIVSEAPNGLFNRVPAPANGIHLQGGQSVVLPPGAHIITMESANNPGAADLLTRQCFVADRLCN